MKIDMVRHDKLKIKHAFLFVFKTDVKLSNVLSVKYLF